MPRQAEKIARQLQQAIGGIESLRYSHDDEPGITRRRSGNRFRYVHTDGKPVRDRATVARVKALRIPPAWTDVWICGTADGHLQATGRDQRGRKQYLYHEQWTTEQSAAKYERLLEFATFLPRIRRHIQSDLAKHGLPKEKVIAAVVRLMQATLIRVGNEQYVRENGSYGLTTLRDRHARVHGERLQLRFRGKGGKWCECDVHDKRLARLVHRCQELPGQQLLQYVDVAGEVRDISSADVNEYLRSTSGHEFTAKDFRTWAATSLALSMLCEPEDRSTPVSTNRRVVAVVDRVAKRLNNTRAICRKSYIHPGVIDAFFDNSLVEHWHKAGRRTRRIPHYLGKQEFLARETLRRLARASVRNQTRGENPSA